MFNKSNVLPILIDDNKILEFLHLNDFVTILVEHSPIGLRYRIGKRIGIMSFLADGVALSKTTCFIRSSTTYDEESCCRLIVHELTHCRQIQDCISDEEYCIGNNHNLPWDERPWEIEANNAEKHAPMWLLKRIRSLLF